MDNRVKSAVGMVPYDQVCVGIQLALICLQNLVGSQSLCG
jgi:hypothetical protein